MTYTEKDIVHENGRFWVLREGKAYKVYEAGITHSTRCGIFALGSDDESRQRAIEHSNRRAEADAEAKTIPATPLPRKLRRRAGPSSASLPLFASYTAEAA